MKIENSGISPLAPKATDPSARVEKKEDRKGVQSSVSGQDKAEMSGSGRILARARIALSNVDETRSDRVATIKSQIASGDYAVQVTDLARKLVARFYPK
jgi:flagellar biosynthesis anti-sigma factor FlgM